MVLAQGEKVHVILRRNFEGDLRRHFVGEIIAASETFVSPPLITTVEAVGKIQPPYTSPLPAKKASPCLPRVGLSYMYCCN